MLVNVSWKYSNTFLLYSYMGHIKWQYVHDPEKNEASYSWRQLVCDYT